MYSASYNLMYYYEPIQLDVLLIMGLKIEFRLVLTNGKFL